MIRPLSVFPLAMAMGMGRMQAALVTWFGIRGIGSLYYLFHALSYDIPMDVAGRMVSIVLCVVALSVFVHGVMVTPLMRVYEKTRQNGAGPSGDRAD